MSIQLIPPDASLTDCITRILNAGDHREPVAQYLALALQQFGGGGGGGGGSQGPPGPAGPAGPAGLGSLTFGNFGAYAFNPTNTSPASANTVNGIPTQDFANGVVSAVFTVSGLPQGATWTTGLKMILKWAGAATGNVMWGIAVEPTEGANISSDHWGTLVTAVGASAGVNIETSTAINVATSFLGTLGPDQLYRLQIQRVGTNGGDTMAGIAHLLQVLVEAY
jgi:hypothetical protein